MKNEKNYITPIGFERLKSEYSQLLNVERPKLVETVAWAASNGDRSENADYIYGKRKLREIDSKLRFLRDRIEKAEIVNPKEITSDKIVFSATVTVQDEDDNMHIYTIVGEDELDSVGNKISWKSPMARALLGKKVGEEVLVKKPNGDEYITIQKLEYK